MARAENKNVNSPVPVEGMLRREPQTPSRTPAIALLANRNDDRAGNLASKRNASGACTYRETPRYAPANKRDATCEPAALGPIPPAAYTATCCTH